MEFYFGEETDLDNVDDIDTLFKCNDKYYYYKFEVDEDGFRLMDTVGRMVPMDFSAAQDLGMAVFGVNQYLKAMEDSNKLFNSRMNELRQLVGFFNKNND